MTPDTAIVAEAIAWAAAKAEHMALKQATYADTGLPSKRDYAALMASIDRMDGHMRALYALALAASGHVAVGPLRQAAMSLEVTA